MQKSNFFTDNPDIEFHLRQRTDFEQMFAWLPQEDKDAIGASTAEEYWNNWLEVLNTVGEFAGTQVAQNAARVEQEEIKLNAQGEVELPAAITENMATFRELGGAGMGISSRYGGLGAPINIELAAHEMLARACPSTLLNACWYSPIAHVIEKFGSDELKNEYIPQIAEGKVSGSMALTEPDVGSDLANLRSYAVKQEDGTWRIHGNKQFITNGSAEISLVLAKNAKGAKGLKSINLYLVPRKIDGKHNFKIAKIEEKTGLHGSATCALEFDGSVGYLVGKDGEGFLYMLLLMNEARIAVAFQGLGLMDAAYRLARDYAEQRQTFGKPIAYHELIAEKLYDMEVEIRALRSLLYQSSQYLALTFLGEDRLKADDASEEEKKDIQKKLGRIKKRLREWTPLVKWIGAERAVKYARDAVQIHGGYGFTKEYKAEWWVRESLIIGIYEGTSQIQGLMCIKDTLKDVIRNPRDFAEVALGSKVKALAETDPLKRKVWKMRQAVNGAIISILFKLVKENVRANLSETKKTDILKVIKVLSNDLVKFENLSPALLHAERICEMKAIVAMARCAVWDAEVDPSRRDSAERFVDRNMPLLMLRRAEIETDDRLLMERIAAFEKTRSGSRQAMS